MSISNNQISVGTAATSLGLNFQMESHVFIHNIDQTDRVYIGNANVTTSNGFALDKGMILEMKLPAGDNLFAVSTKTGHVVSVIQPKPNI